MLDELKYQLASKIQESDQWRIAAQKLEQKVQEMVARDLHARQIQNWLQIKEKGILDLQFQNELLLRDLADYKIKVQQLESERAILVSQLEQPKAKANENQVVVDRVEYQNLLRAKTEKEDLLSKLVLAYARIDSLEGKSSSF